jgi:hypothetical protein
MGASLNEMGAWSGMAMLVIETDGSRVRRLTVKFLLRRLSANTEDAERRARRDRYFILLVFGRYCKIDFLLISLLVD